GVLIGALPLSEAIQTVELEAPGEDRQRFARGHQPAAHSYDVLLAGAQPPNPAELLESQAMKDLLSHVRSDYDLVVLDTPPLTVVSDAFPLLSQVDGVIIVGRVGRNRRDVASHLHEILKGVDAPLLGVVANAFKPGRLGSYGYSYGYYGYGYGYPSKQPAGASPNGAGAAATGAALRMEQPDAPIDRGDAEDR
ncbi:MAG: P-loop NTPase family protein, partial [Solirubrobacteraceae bacterium]